MMTSEALFSGHLSRRDTCSSATIVFLFRQVSSSNHLSAPSFKPSRRMPSSESGRYGALIAGISKRKLQKGRHHQHSGSLASIYFCFCVLCVASFLLFSLRGSANFGAIVSRLRTSVKFPSHQYTVKFPVNAPRHRPEPGDVHITHARA